MNVTLSNVVNLNAWEINVTFNPAILAYFNMTVSVDDLLHSAVNGNSGLTVYFNNTGGYLIAFFGLDDPKLGVNGSGTLCRIVFNASQPGISAVSFGRAGVSPPVPGVTALFDNHQPYANTIPFSVVDAKVTVSASGFNNNPFQITKKGIAYNVNLYTNSTVSNFGYNQTADVIAFSLSGPTGTFGSCIASIPQAMMNGTFAIFVNGSATLFSKSEDGVNEYLYFSYAQSTVRINVFPPIPGDVNGDVVVNMKDLGIVARAFGSYPGSSNWNPVADLNGDGTVNMKDIAIIARNFGRTYHSNY